MKEMPGSMKLIQELKNKGVPMAIATSSAKDSFNKKMTIIKPIFFTTYPQNFLFRLDA